MASWLRHVCSTLGLAAPTLHSVVPLVGVAGCVACELRNAATRLDLSELAGRVPRGTSFCTMSTRRRSPSKSSPARSARVRSGSGLRGTPDEGRRRRAGVADSTPDNTGSSSSRSGALVAGQRVLVCGIKTGVVGYIGATTFGDGVWVGVHLDRPQGLNDGSVAGKRYFTCEPNHVSCYHRAGMRVLVLIAGCTSC